MHKLSPTDHVADWEEQRHSSKFSTFREKRFKLTDIRMSQNDQIYNMVNFEVIITKVVPKYTELKL